ncbi:MAG: 2-polyprenyl-6-methoxyphenol hydroxylase-like FAD-dependent oxidoreductase [Gammaproteobacteria bacterium]|jgi:2-polyprenyl-6-methoxyphenol hydroxylase-like FAD-dependent oxidoreductase
MKQTILIAGGGIGGITAALVLGRQGHTVVVLEQAAEFGEIGAGIQLGPNIFRMLEHLGLNEAVSSVAYFPPGLTMRDVVTDETIVRVPLGDVARATYDYPYGVIYRADLHDVLLNACRELPNVELRASAKVESYVQDKYKVNARLNSGESLSGTLLIGADGMWSRVRESIVADGKPLVSGHIAYRAVLKRADVPAHLWDADVRLWGGEKTHLVTYPLRRGELFNLVAVFHSDKYEEGWNSFGDPGELTSRFSSACAPVKELLSRIETWKMWVLCDRDPVKNWSMGRVSLLGDAAHPMLQYLAQGAGQAIEDSVVLGLAIDQFDGDVVGALQQYAQTRYLRTARVQLTARFYGGIYHATGVTRELRNHMFQGGNEAAGFAGLKWMYDGIDPTKL